jgi:anion-transporting  ArsA/GET3 family ATPase
LEEAKRTFLVVANETYLNLEKTFASHNIFPEKIVEQRFVEFKQVNPNETQKVDYELLTPSGIHQKKL